MSVDSFHGNDFICHGQIGFTVRDRKLLSAEWGNGSQENKILLSENLILNQMKSNRGTKLFKTDELSTAKWLG